MGKSVKHPPVQPSATNLSALLRELFSPPRTLSPEDAADEAASRIIASVERDRAEAHSHAN